MGYSVCDSKFAICEILHNGKQHATVVTLMTKAGSQQILRLSQTASEIEFLDSHIE